MIEYDEFIGQDEAQSGEALNAAITAISAMKEDPDVVIEMERTLIVPSANRASPLLTSIKLLTQRGGD
jgi:hypothetical protein